MESPAGRRLVFLKTYLPDMLKDAKKIELAILLLVIIAAIFFRFWHIRDYVVFLGDEGRDMIVIHKIFTEASLPFLGPTASVGGFYLGPIYYWMAAPFLALAKFDPVGPAYFVAAIGVATVYLLYKFLKDSVGFWPAILASSLYATAPLIVRYSRSSWNPNPLPFFALLAMYLVYLGIRHRKIAYFLFAGFCLGIIVQLHYLASILVAIFALIIFLSANFKKWPKIILVSFCGFLITFSPFLLFEIKNGFPNFQTILEFVTRGTTLGYKTTNFVWLVSNMGNILIEELTGLRGTIVTKLAFWVLAGGGFFGLYKYRKKTDKKLVFKIAIIWFVGGLVGLRFYAGQIFDYYFGFMFPTPFLLAGLVIYLVWQNFYGRILSTAITIFALIFFVSNGFWRHPPNRLIDQTAHVANFVIEKSQGQPFNFALISPHNSDHAYRYFLEIKGHQPTELETLVTEQLLVVCEAKKCAPLGHPIWEIAGFGRAEIAGEWELENIGIRVFKLIHWPGEPNPAGKPAVKGG